MDGLVLIAVLAAATAGGLAMLRALRALPEEPGDRLLAGAAVGLGLAGAAGLGLAAFQQLRLIPVLGIGVAAFGVGVVDLVRALTALEPKRLRPLWPILIVCAGILGAELFPMLAPPIGGDQTKYHLVYPRLYAEHGGLVPTPWSFWGNMQFLPNFLYAIGFVLRGDVLARLMNGAFGVLAAIALGRLVGRHLAPRAGAIAGAVFFTLPMTFTLMVRAGSDLAVVLYATLATTALLDWASRRRTDDLRLAGVAAGLAGGCKVMGLLVPALVGLAILVVLARRSAPVGAALRAGLVFGILALGAASPPYARNWVDTGNPLYPFGYGVFGGRYWSRAASDYLGDYYRQYQATYALRREDAPYAGIRIVRFPWDLTVHPDSFENAARQSLDVSPFALAFLPALVLVARRRRAVLMTAAIGIAYVGIIAVGAWAHPRYVIPGVALALAAAIPAARALLGPRIFVAMVTVTIAGNLALTSRLLRPLWRDQVKVVAGRMRPDDYLRRNSTRFQFWERANALVPANGEVLVLEKIPHPYYIERPYVLASYLEQGLIDYRVLRDPETLGEAVRELGVTHVAVDVAGLEAAGDPFEAAVAGLWRRFLRGEAEPLLRHAGFALYQLRPTTAFAAVEVPRE